jgi:hypothetical protein
LLHAQSDNTQNNKGKRARARAKVAGFYQIVVYTKQLNSCESVWGFIKNALVLSMPFVT